MFSGKLIFKTILSEIVFIIFTLFLTPFNTSHYTLWAQDCGTTTDEATAIDLRKPGQSLSEVPIFDQDGEGSCFAQAAAGLATAYLGKVSRGTNQPKTVFSPYLSYLVAAHRSAEEFFKRLKRNTKDTEHMPLSNPCYVADTLRKLGGTDFRDTLIHFKDKAQYLDILDKISDSSNSCSPWSSAGNLNKFLNLIAHLNRKLYTETSPIILSNLGIPEALLERRLASGTMETREKIKALFRSLRPPNSSPPLSEDELDELVKRFPQKFNNGLHSIDKETDERNLVASVPDPLINIALITPKNIRINSVNGKLEYRSDLKVPFQKCMQEELLRFDGTPNETTFKQEPHFHPKYFQERINSKLDQNDQPVSIAFCASFLYDEKETGDLWRERKWECQIGGKPDTDHNVLVIGRRLNQGRCEFLMRNSFGNECTEYTPHYRRICEEEKTKTGYADVWIPAETLSRSTHNLIYLE